MYVMITIGIVLGILFLAVVLLVIFDSEEFPDCYNPACFDCNKGGESCPTCKYLDKDYRDPKGTWAPETNNDKEV